MVKLYEIPIEAEDIERQLEELQGELTPELEARIAEFLHASKEKLEAAAMVVKRLESDVAANKDVAKFHAERAQRLEANADRLKKLMVHALDEGFGGKVKTALFSLWCQNAAPSYEVIAEVPLDVLEKSDPDLVRVERKLNLKAITEAAKMGAPMPQGLKVRENPPTRYLRVK